MIKITFNKMFSLTEFNSSYAVLHFLLGLIENLPTAIELRWDDFVTMALASATDLLSHTHIHLDMRSTGQRVRTPFQLISKQNVSSLEESFPPLCL